jgi:hypothetical protein
MNGNFSGGSFSGAVGGFSVDGVLATDTVTPGRRRHLGRHQYKVEDDSEKLARRIREGTIKLPPAPPKDDSAYHLESARLARQISQARQEAAESRSLIADLEAHQDLLRQSAIVQAKLLRAQQALLKAEIEEAVRLEEMQVIDIAFLAKTALEVIELSGVIEVAGIAMKLQ